MRHAFTVDVEDWYHGIPVEASVRDSAERRIDRGMNVLLDSLAANGHRGTFFVLGTIAKEHPALVRRMASEGHEIGCHGWSHELVYRLGERRFRAETRRAVDAIADVTGERVTAYRAAYFSVTRASWWALEILVELGFQYDSSIFPVRNWRYGIPDFPLGPHRVDTPSGSILEFPLTVRRWFGRNVPVAGGAYFRIYPYALTRANIRAVESEGRPFVFYLHPWELDPGHPRVPFDWRASLTHYHRLDSTEPKLKRLVSEFSFGALRELLPEREGSASH